ncbi:MAG: methyltransferase domain-containing protein [Coriobacteriia bacterium]|nr:methyltransferase domain-containing protein [Coriobacteriia bacterium]
MTTPASPTASRRRLLVALQWALTALTVGVIVWYLAPNLGDIAAVSRVTPGLLLVASAGLALQFLANGMVFRLLVEHFGKPMRLGHAILIGLMDSTLNYLPMKAGTVATGFVLVRQYGIQVGDFAAIVAGATVLNVWLAALVSGICLLLLGIQSSIALSVIVVSTLLVATLMTWGRMHKPRAADELSRVRRGITHMVSGMALIFQSPRLVGGLTALNLVRLSAVALVLYASFAAISHGVSGLEALAIAGLAFVLGRLSILPGGLGFKEAGIAGTAVLIGVPAVYGLAAAVIDRGVMAAALVVLGIPATIWVLTRSHTTLAGATAGLEEAGPVHGEPGDAHPIGNYYDKYNTRNPVSRYLMNRFRADLGALWAEASPRSQLDVGCGEGVITCDWAASLGEGRVVGLDQEDARLRAEWASRHRPNLEFVSGDAATLGFADGEFDLVSAIEVLEHLPDPRTALSDMARVAGCYLLLSVPREPIWRALNMVRGAHWRTLGNTPGHIQHWSRREFVRFASSFGEVVGIRSPLPWTIVLVRLGSEPAVVRAVELHAPDAPPDVL